MRWVGVAGIAVGVAALLFFYGVARALLTDPEPSDSDGSTR